MSITSRPAILVDIDSTLYNADPVYLKYLRSLFGVRVNQSQCDEYNFWKGRITEEQFLLVITHIHSGPEILRARPYAGAVATLSDWRKAGVRIHIVSDRKPGTIPATKSWLKTHRVPADVVILESRIDKLAYARAHGISLIIDDKPALLRAAAEAGIGAASIRHTYHDAALRADPRVLIASNWGVLRRKLTPRLLAPKI